MPAMKQITALAPARLFGAVRHRCRKAWRYTRERGGIRRARGTTSFPRGKLPIDLSASTKGSAAYCPILSALQNPKRSHAKAPSFPRPSPAPLTRDLGGPRRRGCTIGHIFGSQTKLFAAPAEK